MVVFWLLAAVMLALALAIVLPPLLGVRRRSDEHDLRAETNVALYRERLSGIEAEHAAGDLDDGALEEARRELQRELLHDTGVPQPADGGTRGASPIIAVLVAATLPLLGFGLYLHLGEPAALDPAALVVRDVERSHADNSELDTGAMEGMVANLAARLQAQPDDGEGWMMLGRSYTVLERHAAAAEAYSRAHDLLGEQPDLLVDWAEAIGMAEGESLRGRPRELIDRTLELQPDNAKGLWLGGFAEMQSNNPTLAVERWTRLRTLLPPGSEARAALDNMLSEIGVAAATTGGDASASPTPAATGVSVTVDVTLARELTSRLQGDETLFVFARAAQGPRIPLAVVRVGANALPFTTTLDESQAMQPGMTIASVPEIIVGARVTRGGQPTASSGDLQGFSAAIVPGTVDRVRVIIDQVVP